MAERSLRINAPDGIDTPRLDGEMASGIPGAVMAAWRELLAAHASSGGALASLTPQQAFQYPYLGDPAVTAVVSTAPGVKFLEYGRAGFSLAQHWGRGGGKWKGVTKKGVPYAYVPFRISTPADTVRRSKTGAIQRVNVSSARRRYNSTMPPDVYSAAKKLGPGGRLGGFGNFYKQHKSYNYYRSIFGGQSEIPDAAGYTWASSQFEGMFRNIQQNPETGSKSSEYITIRTITADSQGWWIPPTPAHFYAEIALDRALPVIEKMADIALAADMEASVMQATEGM